MSNIHHLSPVVNKYSRMPGMETKSAGAHDVVVLFWIVGRAKNWSERAVPFIDSRGGARPLDYPERDC